MTKPTNIHTFFPVISAQGHLEGLRENELLYQQDNFLNTTAK